VSRFNKVMVAVAVVAGLLAVGAAPATAQYPSYPVFPPGPGVNPGPVILPPAPLYPQVPISSSTGVTGVNPFTGGLDTGGTTFFNSAYDPYRTASMFNGSMRPVNRPLPGGGVEVGVEWYNPVTGQVHGQTNQFRPNGLGGVNNQMNVYGARGRRR
jgi:hypothetical protein